MKTAQQLVLAILLLAFAWLNWRDSYDGLFKVSKGFPCAFLTSTDVIGSARIHVWALAADAAMGAGLLLLAARRRPQIAVSVPETMILIVFALGFLWANNQMWFGIQHLLQKAPWIDRGNEIVVYGFPSAYHVLVPHNSMRPWMLIGNITLGGAVMFMIHRKFRNSFPPKLPNPRAGR